MLAKLHQQQVTRGRGNILILTCLSFGIISLSLVVAYSFCGLVFINNRLQASAGEIALAGAKKLNDRDRLGQMNNMIARCRQLVHASRKDYERTRQEFPQLEAIALPLLEESRESAVNLETERARVVGIAKREAADEMLQRFEAIRPSYPMQLPWLQVDAPQLTRIALGRLDSVESNVAEFTAFSDLVNQDRRDGNVVTGAAINLYKGDKDLSLVSEPGLHFKVSSLPAPVQKTIAPARIALARTYKSVTGDFCPSAAQVHLQLKIQTSLGFKTYSTMSAVGTASTTGASPQQ